MANRQPWRQFFYKDWMLDPNLGQCSPATQGIWINMLCVMWEGSTGHLEGTPVALARLCRCDPEEMISALEELRSTETASVFVRGDSGDCPITCPVNVRVVSRRLNRELSERNSDKERKKRKRSSSVSGKCPDEVPEDSEESRSFMTVTVNKDCISSVLEEEKPEGTQRTPEPEPKPDPLEGLPLLSEFYEPLIEMMSQAFSGRGKFRTPPDPIAWKETLRKLVRPDGYAEADIIKCLTWLYQEEDQSGEFSWRRQARSLGNLRDKKRSGVYSKFDKIFVAWKDEKSNHGRTAHGGRRAGLPVDKLW